MKQCGIFKLKKSADQEAKEKWFVPQDCCSFQKINHYETPCQATIFFDPASFFYY